jgi:hypothetical protein
MKVIMHVPHRFSGIGTPAPLLTRPVAIAPPLTTCLAGAIPKSFGIFEILS